MFHLIEIQHIDDQYNYGKFLDVIGCRRFLLHAPLMCVVLQHLEASGSAMVSL